jgi:GxxExxY protein
MQKKMIYEELSEKIISAAMHVLNELRPGLDEKFYERALVIELEKRDHSIQAQRCFPVFYETHSIGDLVPDLIVDNTIIVDPKVVVAFNEAHISQMIGYLAITGLEPALLLNLKSARLEWKRVVRQQKDGPEMPDLHG